jgi:PKD repeat protein
MEIKMKNLILAAILILTFVNNSYSQNPVILNQLSDSLVAYYPFNGDALDASGNYFDGDVWGATLANDVNGTPNSAYSFNGYSDYIDVGEYERLRIRGDLTLGVWMNANDLNTLSPSLISCAGGNLDYNEMNVLYKLYFRYGGHYVASMHEYGAGNKNLFEFTEFEIETHRWYHVVLVRNSIEKKLTLYIDGLLIGSRFYAENPDGGSYAGLIFGQTQTTQYSGKFFNGIMDEIVIYNRVLNQDEIDLLYYSHKSISADFTSNVTWGEVPLTVNFTDLSSASGESEINSWMWDFTGDGIIDSYEQNPTWVFDEPGSYDITLTVSDDNNQNVITKFEYINVITEYPTIIGFDHLPEYQGGYVYLNFLKSIYDTGMPQPSTQSPELYTVEYNRDNEWFALNTTAAYGKLKYSILVTIPETSTWRDSTEYDFRVIAALDEGIFISNVMSVPVSNHVTDINEESPIPEGFKLSQNYPNPFNASTMIHYNLPEAGNVTISVFNTLGEKLNELTESNLGAGTYKYEWNASNFSSGIYIYNIVFSAHGGETYAASKKMVLLK